MKKIGILVGSLRKESWNRKVAEAIVDLFPEGYAAEIIEIKDLPFYTEDFDSEGSPAVVTDFRAQVGAKDAFLFVTPEYNRNITAPLKNALDTASRPYGQNQWNGKPAAVISATVGSTGAMAANLSLRNSFIFLNMPLLQQPEVFLSAIAESFDEEGHLVERTKKFLQEFVDAYIAFINRF